MPLLRRVLLVAVLAALLAAGLYVAVSVGWVYSSGERAGWLQKFSRKGWVCKTWEGELAMVSLPGSIPEKFAFTVRDEAVAEKVSRFIGQRVQLHYEQHRGLPGDCLGETGYWVTSVSLLADPPAPLPR